MGWWDTAFSFFFCFFSAFHFAFSSFTCEDIKYRSIFQDEGTRRSGLLWTGLVVWAEMCNAYVSFDQTTSEPFASIQDYMRLWLSYRVQIIRWCT